jgi:hypothetical protein
MSTVFGKRLFFACALFAAACGSGLGDKPKVAIDEGDGKGSLVESLSLAGSGNFQEVRVIDTPHSYRNSYTRRWDVTGSADAIEMKVTFTRFELENGYDFITISDGSNGQQTRHTGNKSGTDLIVTGNRLTIVLTTDSSITAWGARMTISERLPCVCSQTYEPVCGANGNTYSNSCFASCENVGVSHLGSCLNVWQSVGRPVESVHPYVDNFSNTWTITEPGARFIRAHFSRIDIERSYDFLTVLDGGDRVVATYTGTQDDVTTPAVAGDTLKVRFSSDVTITAYGFALDYYEVQGGCSMDAECGQGMQCMQVQCIQAPCFNSCFPISGGYTVAAAADLGADPMRFNGQKVSVVAVPTTNGAACTRVACSASNPCCNRCSASFSIEGGILLEDANRQSFSCGGNECNWSASCRPFAAENAGPYELNGTFSIDQYGTKRIVIDSFQATGCSRQGCGGQVCANSQVITTCDGRPEYACFASAECRAQNDGHCGFTRTPELDQCIATAGVTTRVIESSDTPIRIPDNDQSGIVSRIIVPRQSTNVPVKVSLDITHTYRGDLRVVLIAPNGTENVLHDQSGGSYDNLVIRDVTVGTLDAGAIGGEWRLIVRDRAAADIGTLDRWSLTLN